MFFFQKLGTNGRTCATCHQLDQGMSINLPRARKPCSRARVAPTSLFEAVDGANCPTVATGNTAGHSLVLNNGLIRVAVEPPLSAQFTIAPTSDPYGCALAPDASTGQQIVSVYRRPLPASSLTFLSNVMWDTRETVSPLNAAATFTANLASDLSAQAVSAVETHETGRYLAIRRPNSAQLVAFNQGALHGAGDGYPGGVTFKWRRDGAERPSHAETYHPGHQRCVRPGSPRALRFNPQIFSPVPGLEHQCQSAAGQHRTRAGSF